MLGDSWSADSIFNASQVYVYRMHETKQKKEHFNIKVDSHVKLYCVQSVVL